jgi:hypothetical protein
MPMVGWSSTGRGMRIGAPAALHVAAEVDAEALA